MLGRHGTDADLRAAPGRARLRRLAIMGAIVLPIVTTGFVLGPATGAYAGEWVQAACVNPSQSAAPSEGW